MSFKLTVNKNETVTGTSSRVKFPDLKWKFNDLLTSNLSSYTSSCLETLTTWIFHYNLQLIISKSNGFTMAPNYLPFSWLLLQSRALPHYPGQKTLGYLRLPFFLHLPFHRGLGVAGLPLTWLWISLGFGFASLFSPPPSQFRSLSHHDRISRKAHPQPVWFCSSHTLDHCPINVSRTRLSAFHIFTQNSPRAPCWRLQQIWIHLPFQIASGISKHQPTSVSQSSPAPSSFCQHRWENTLSCWKALFVHTSPSRFQDLETLHSFRLSLH